MSDVGRPSVRLIVAPADDYFALDDSRWHDELAELDRELRRNVGDDALVTEPAEGDKGIELVSIIIALGSAGVFTAAVDAFKAWLAQRPKQRALTVQYELGDRTGEVRIDGNNVNDEVLTTAFASVNEALRTVP